MNYGFWCLFFVWGIESITGLVVNILIYTYIYIYIFFFILGFLGF